MAFYSIPLAKSLQINVFPNPITPNQSFSYPSVVCFPAHHFNSACFGALRARRSNQEAYGSDMLRKPETLGAVEGKKEVSRREFEGGDNNEEEYVDWEDRILEDTVPLVGFVRMVLHSGKYESGDRLSPEHEKTILERLLPYHPECEKKIGSGVDYITIGYHPDFESSRCLFIVQKDGKLVDFSYWKCLKGLIRKNYPLYADSFILRHFRQRRRSD
ncbi:protein DCL-like [Heracleum sosnowskyi]|uniref:Protein DCL-like n=1 Tax=Heracleum sosnowskyi TaxID=360622 RepID=A0AAD8J141_9APIA|nr:protein DCL-like [Heracleum sosnowskyi]